MSVGDLTCPFLASSQLVNDCRYSQQESLLASARYLLALGQADKALATAASVLLSSETLKGHGKAELMFVEAAIIIAKAKVTSTTKIVLTQSEMIDGDDNIRANRAELLEDVNRGNAIDIGTMAVRQGVTAIQETYLFGNEEPRNLESIARYFKSLLLSFEARSFMSEVFKWTGLAVEQHSINHALRKISNTLCFATNIVESLLTSAEAALTLDEPQECKSLLSQVEDALGEIVCTHGKASKAKSSSALERLSTADISEDMAGASPALPRMLYKLPKCFNESYQSLGWVEALPYPKAVEFTIKFFTYYGVAYHMMQDEEGALWMINKADSLLEASFMKSVKNRAFFEEKMYSQCVLLACLNSLHWQVEVFGQRGNIEKAISCLQKQSSLLQMVNKGTMQSHPVLIIDHAQQVKTIDGMKVASIAQKVEQTKRASEPSKTNHPSNVLTAAALQQNHGDFLTPKAVRLDKQNSSAVASNLLLTPSSIQHIGDAPTKHFLPGAKGEFESLTASNLLPVIKDVDVEESKCSQDPNPNVLDNSSPKKQEASKNQSSQPPIKTTPKPSADGVHVYVQDSEEEESNHFAKPLRTTTKKPQSMRSSSAKQQRSSQATAQALDDGKPPAKERQRDYERSTEIATPREKRFFKSKSSVTKKVIEESSGLVTPPKKLYIFINASVIFSF